MESLTGTSTSTGTVGGEYHALLARHDAMRLRNRLLSPRRSAEPDLPGPARYDGAADQRLITEYLDLVTPFGELIEHLYAEMFRRRPYLRSLFPASMDFQRAHLARIFRYLIENLHDPDEVAALFTRLGRDHRKLGVRPVHYRTFEAALRVALRRTAGGRWTDAVEAAWVRMLRFAVAAMVEGAEATLAEPPYWQATVTAHELRRPDLAVLRVRPHEPYPYRAGQYAAVESPLLPQAWRPYSLACAPRPEGELELHVRQTCEGGVSEALVTRTLVGDVLRLGPANGTMTLDDDALGRDLLLVAGGTGWAPVKALVEELAGRRPGGAGRPVRAAQERRRVQLFLGARSRDELYDARVLADWADCRPWLRVVTVLDEGAAAGAYGPVAEAVARHGDWSGHLAYVSGPPAMVGATVSRLTGAGLPADRIRHDPLLDAGGIRPRPAVAR
ncbi:globin domain-containing protein [Streptomyces nigrescens]|uniref:globin domain-containing protein n=1 Tax=Streptomyces nigrescens TaxID=1920 RepID=UPI00368F1A16